ncbi:MAG: phosphoribosyl-AMP cyclohydrolase [Methylobacteriaceae bacterium]|jgi:phosphoribosyl-AMP cyclohydrolase|nr:phosphoribosyl-AMP cyclohydrolase [Methylobacteriaceae bacterium]
MTETSPRFTFDSPSADASEQETGTVFRPRFDANGLIPCVTIDAKRHDVLMVAWMNRDALSRTLETGEAWYWSRSRAELWHKGETSGQIQKVVSLVVDCDQDTLVLAVNVLGDGGCCHTGRRSCFYRSVDIDGPGRTRLVYLPAAPS